MLKSVKPILSLLALGALLLPSSFAQDLRGNAFFKALEGKWKGQGQLAETGKPSQLLRNQIQVGFQDAGALFIIEGALILGEDKDGVSPDPMIYRWEIRRSAKPGAPLQGRLLPKDGDPGDFDITIDEATATAHFVQRPLPDDPKIFKMTKQVKGNEYLVLLTQFDPNGTQTLAGELKFTRLP